MDPNCQEKNKKVSKKQIDPELLGFIRFLVLPLIL